MTQSEFEFVRNSRQYLVKEICKSYCKSLNPSMIKEFKLILDRYISISEFKKNESISTCFQSALQESLSIFFVNNLKEIGYDVAEVLDDLNISKNKDYDYLLNILWSLHYTDKLRDSFIVECDKIFLFYMKRYPEVIQYIFKIKLNNW